MRMVGYFLTIMVWLSMRIDHIDDKELLIEQAEFAILNQNVVWKKFGGMMAVTAFIVLSWYCLA